MHVQITGIREFIVSKESVIKIIRGTRKNRDNPLAKDIFLNDGTIVDMKDDVAKRFLKRYPKNFQAWGPDALANLPKKAKSAKPRSVPKENDDIA